MNVYEYKHVFVTANTSIGTKLLHIDEFTN